MPASARCSSEPALLAKWLPKIQTRDLRSAAAAVVGEERRDPRHGHDRAPGRHRRARQHHRRRCAAGDHVEITGHKWFMSAPMCDAFLVLAQAQMGQEGGLTCYLMPRYRPDGSQNAIRFQRLKDKLGNKSNASSEVEFHGAYAERVGAEGAGVRTIIEMVNLTRLDCAIASAGQIAHRAQPGAEPHPQPLGLPAPARRPAGDARHRRRPGARARGAGRAGVPPLPRLGARRIGSGARQPTCGCSPRR